MPRPGPNYRRIYRRVERRSPIWSFLCAQRGNDGVTQPFFVAIRAPFAIDDQHAVNQPSPHFADKILIGRPEAP